MVSRRPAKPNGKTPCASIPWGSSLFFSSSPPSRGASPILSLAVDWRSGSWIHNLPLSIDSSFAVHRFSTLSFPPGTFWQFRKSLELELAVPSAPDTPPSPFSFFRPSPFSLSFWWGFPATSIDDSNFFQHPHPSALIVHFSGGSITSFREGLSCDFFPANHSLYVSDYEEGAAVGCKLQRRNTPRECGVATLFHFGGRQDPLFDDAPKILNDLRLALALLFCLSSFASPSFVFFPF